MPLALYGHPFSSYTQKALIALYENATPFEFRCIGPDTPQHAADWLRRYIAAARGDSAVLTRARPLLMQQGRGGLPCTAEAAH